MLIFHNHRRDEIAKSLFDIFKLTTVAGCVSGFFSQFNLATKITIWVSATLSFILAILICPPKKED